MALFFITVLSIYSAMHAVVFVGVKPLIPPRHHLALALALWMGAMILAPFAARLLEHGGLETAARVVALAGYTWMGFLFLAFAGFALIYLWDLLVFLVTCLTQSASALLLYGPKSAAAVLAVTLLLGLYGFTEAHRLRIETVRIETDKLPAGVNALRVVQISDLHLGLILREGTLERIAEAIDGLQPELVVATGDMVDARIDRLGGLAERFAALRPRLGKYAVTGNHEFYAGQKQALDFIRRGGFTVLRGEVATAGGMVNIAGVDDPAGGGDPDEVPILQRADKETFTILLKHRPRVAANAEGLFDLQLSGHAHRGQIFPFNLVTGLFYPRQDGLYRLAGGALLYASRGTGTWGPPMRILAPPEITLFEIVSKPEAKTDLRERGP